MDNMTNKNKTIKKVIVIIIVILAVVGSFFLGYFIKASTITEEDQAIINLIDKYKKYYLYEEDDIIGLISDAILDDYSEYYTKEEIQAVNEKAKGINAGIGVSLSKDNLEIKKVVLNSSCDRVGVKVGGNIIAVKTGNSFTSVTNFDELSNVLDNVAVNSEVTIKVQYDVVKEYTVKKEVYRQTFVEYSSSTGHYTFMDNSNGDVELTRRDNGEINVNGIGYIVYHSFQGTENGLNGSYGQLQAVLNKMKDEGNTKLIFDLRGNGGGYLTILANICRLLVPAPEGTESRLLTKVIDKYGNQNYYNIPSSLFSSFNIEKIIILADENSASASEAFIGAMLDYDYQNIVKVYVSSSEKEGQTVYKTYGKGIMQNTYMNSDGSGVKLTIAELYWPVSKISIHGIGVTPSTSTKVTGVDKNLVLSKAIFDIQID